MLAGAQRSAHANPKLPPAPHSFESLLPQLPLEEQERLQRVVEEENERYQISKAEDF